MNGLIGMAYLLSQTPLTNDQRTYAKTSLNSGESLMAIINDILDFSKIESGRMELDRHEIELRECIEEVLILFADKASRQGVELLYLFEENVTEKIITDGLRLKQVLINLIGKAIKFTSEGEILVQVALEEHRDEDIVLSFSIKDTGIGIAEEKLKHLFKAFSQVDSSTTRKYGGTGLGLVICEKLIQLMGGDIRVESEEGKGTNFLFTILAKSTQEQNSFILPKYLEGKKISVIEPHAASKALITSLLTRWNLKSTVFSSLAEIPEDFFKKESIDLIIIDVKFIDSLKKWKFNKEVLMVFISTWGDDLSSNHETSHVSSFLTKPLSHKKLFTTVINRLEHVEKSSASVGNFSETSIGSGLSEKYPLKILIAEDNPVNQTLAIHILKKLGYAADIVETGFEVIEALNEFYYHLILMDIQMPGMDGLLTTQQIRSGNYKQPVIVAMTANAMHGDREKCIKAGMNDYLSKPVRLEDVLKILTKWAPLCFKDKLK